MFWQRHHSIKDRNTQGHLAHLERRIKQWTHARKLVLLCNGHLEGTRGSIEAMLPIVQERIRYPLHNFELLTKLRVHGVDLLKSHVEDALYLRADRADAYLTMISMVEAVDMLAINTINALPTPNHLQEFERAIMIALERIGVVKETFDRVLRSSIPGMMVVGEAFSEPY
jgi:hypothetical protein